LAVARQHSDPQISRFAAISKQIKDFHSFRNTSSSGICLAFSAVVRWNAGERRGGMAMILIFASRWNRWYRVLRYRKGFGLSDSVRYGLWLARGCA